jgi:hypothetical protein
MKKNKNRKDEVKFADSRTSHCTMSVSSVSFCTERIMLGNRSKERFVEMSMSLPIMDLEQEILLD